MELFAALAILVFFGVLAVAFGTDSRPSDDPGPWWPGTRGENT